MDSYIVCLNEEERRKDAHDRAAIVTPLRDQLTHGDKSLVGNKGYRRYLRLEGPGHFAVDDARILDEARFDGIWVLRTNTAYPAATVAVQYKRLWMVEAMIRTTKAILETRPIYHKCDETIRGHVFCSFLALVLMKELEDRLAARGHELEWADVLRDLGRLRVRRLRGAAGVCERRSAPRGVAGKVVPAAGVALGPPLRFIDGQE